MVTDDTKPELWGWVQGSRTVSQHSQHSQLRRNRWTTFSLQCPRKLESVALILETDTLTVEESWSLFCKPSCCDKEMMKTIFIRTLGKGNVGIEMVYLENLLFIHCENKWHAVFWSHYKSNFVFFSLMTIQLNSVDFSFCFKAFRSEYFSNLQQN